MRNLARRVRRYAGPALLSGFAFLVVLSGLLTPATRAQAQVPPPTSTATQTATGTATRTATSTSTQTSTSTATQTSTATVTPTQAPTQTATATATQTATHTATVTQTAGAIVALSTVVTSTSTSTSTATSTSTSSAGASPTATASATATATATATQTTSSSSCGQVTGGPESRWRDAFDCLATVQTARVASSVTIKQGTQTQDISSNVTLVRGNKDIAETRSAPSRPPTPTPSRVVPGNRTSPIPTPGPTTRKRVDVGSSRYEKEEGSSSGRTPPGWQRKNRPDPAPSSGATAFGALTLADGTSLGTTSLYTDIRNQGNDPLPNVSHTFRLEGTFDMAALARAGQLSGSEAARVGRGSATLSVWVGQQDGLIYKTKLVMTLPSPTGGQPDIVHTSTVEITDHNASLSVVAPR